MSIKFDIFERDVIKTIASKQNELSEYLLQQYRQAEIVSREFTGHGFFTNFSVDNIEIQLPLNFTTFKLSCLGEIDGIKNGVGFILFINNGFIKMLEGYTYGDEKWVNEINGYRFCLPTSTIG